MTVPIEQFVKQLEDSGIVAGETLKDYIPPKADPKNADELAGELVRQNKLTKFQADLISKGEGTSLVLGNYVLLDKIGQGGMGAVYKAQHRRMKRTVAIKMLPPGMMKDAAAAARFQREVEVAARLRHPNIVAADDADEANGVHFLVMECVDGDDLSALVKKNGPYTVARAVNYILQAARGLEFAHKKGVIHRDIKPANLLLDSEGTVKILDMGLARIEGDTSAGQAELTGTGAVMGTVDYMAPEQALSTKNADARADIYSLGCSLYYLLSGRATYGGDTMMAKLLAHREQPIPSLQDVQATVPKPVEAVFKKMVAKKAKDRYQTMSEVVDALESLRIGGSASKGSGEAATVLELSPDDKKKLGAAAAKTPIEPKTEILTVEKSKHLILKLAGGTFATIIAPILVTFLIKYLEKKNEPPNSPAAVASVVPADAVTAGKTDSSDTNAGAETGKATPVDRNKPWESAAFRQWMKDVAALPAGEQVEAVSRKLVALNPEFDGKVNPQVDKGMVTDLEFCADNVTDISPVRALAGLIRLECRGSKEGKGGKLSDLSPLLGMKLTNLNCHKTKVFDLSPLNNMPLVNLNIANTRVKDLSPIKGPSLTSLTIIGAPVTDLTALKGMSSLTTFLCEQTKISDVSPLADCKALTLLKLPMTVTPVAVEALQKALPNCDIKWKDPSKATTPAIAPASPRKPWESPAFQQWMKDVAAMPAEKQIEAVSKKLMELNPRFDGKVTGWEGIGSPKIENGVVMEVGLVTDHVTDISPVRAFASLLMLKCSGSAFGKGNLSDLSPLQGMRLNSLNCNGTRVSDLSPLRDMPLKAVSLDGTPVTDLSPLKGMRLQYLAFSFTQVSTLSPLAEMPLGRLNFASTLVADLSSLKGMPLTELHCQGTKVSDLSPLRGMQLDGLRLCHVKASDLTPIEGMPLRDLELEGMDVTDLSPLAGMKLTRVTFDPAKIKQGIDILRKIDTVKQIGPSHDKLLPPAEFWKKYEAGEFSSATNTPVATKVPVATEPNVVWPFDLRDGREYVWSEPENLGPTINTDKDEHSPSASGDGLSLVFVGVSGTMRETRRSAPDQPFGKPELSVQLGKADLDRAIGPYLASDGLALYFTARTKSAPMPDETWAMYVLLRTSRDGPWRTPAKVPGISDKQPRITLTPDGLTAYFSAHRPEVSKQNALFTAGRQTLDSPFESATLLGLDYKALGPVTNPHLMSDGRTLVFRCGGSKSSNERFLWAERDATGQWTARPFVRRGGDSSDDRPSLTADGRTMYFASSRPGGLGGQDLWVTRRVR